MRYEQFGAHDKCWHNADAISASQYLVSFFVAECSKSTQRFASDEEELSHIIWNFDVKFTGNHQHVHWLQCFLFGDMSGDEHK